MALTWPPLPVDTVGISPAALDILVALPTITDAWGHSHWGVGHWGGYDFDNPVPMECDAQGVNIEIGRTDPLSHVASGGAAITVQDPDREWAPWVIPADGFRKWRTGVPIQVRTPHGYLFTGSVTYINAKEAPEPDVARTVEIGCRDPLNFLAISDQTAQPPPGAGARAGPRLERIWNFASMPHWARHRFDPGQATMQATTLAQAALTEMWLTADSDAGMLTCTTDGVVQYWASNIGLADPRRVVPQVTFTDSHDYIANTPTVCAQEFTVDDDQAFVTNWVGIAATGGTQEISTDETSISWYGRRTTHRNDLIHAEGQTWSKKIADIFLTRVTRQSVVISPLIFNALQSQEAWDAVHFLEVGDRVAVHREADGNRIDVEASIDQITHNITPAAWKTTIQLAPGTQRTAYPRWGRALWGVDPWS